MTEINVTFEMIKEAEKLLKGKINKTPLQSSRTFSEIANHEVYLKPENLQKTGSYKTRGAFFKLSNLSQEEKERGVLTASAGNHAQGLAYAAKLLGIKATVFMPLTAPFAKVDATKGYGAQVFQVGSNFDETTQKAREWQKKNNALFVSPFDDDYIIAGQGTIGLEILAECPQVSTIVLPVGGGGVISGVSLAIKHLKPDVRIIGVQAAGSPAIYQSFKEGKLVHVRKSDTIADGINIKEPTNRTFEIIKKYVDDIVLVDDEEISEAMIYLMERSKLIVEPSGAVALGALLSKKVSVNDTTVIVISGGNVDIKMLGNIIQRGMVKAGRYLKFITMISDSPGSLHRLLGLLFEHKASIMNIQHDRYRNYLKLGETEVEITIETKDQYHNSTIISELRKAGYNITII